MKKSLPAGERFFQRLFIVVVLALIAVSFLPGKTYSGLTAEDGPMENITCILEFLGAYFCLKIFLLRQKLFSRFDLAVLFIGGLFLLVAAEEISWGQRIIGLKPILIKHQELNYQRETNIHNIAYYGKFIVNAGMASIFICTAILPIFTYFFAWARKLYARFGIPLMPRIICAFMWLGSILLVIIPRMRYGRWSSPHSSEEFITMYCLKQLSHLVFAVILFGYIFVEYFHLLKYKRPYEV